MHSLTQSHARARGADCRLAACSRHFVWSPFSICHFFPLLFISSFTLLCMCYTSIRVSANHHFSTTLFFTENKNRVLVALSIWESTLKKNSIVEILRSHSASTWTRRAPKITISSTHQPPEGKFDAGKKNALLSRTTHTHHPFELVARHFIDIDFRPQRARKSNAKFNKNIAHRWHPPITHLRIVTFAQVKSTN